MQKIKLANGWLPLRCDKERQAHSIHEDAHNVDIRQDFVGEFFVTGVVDLSKISFTHANSVVPENVYH